MSIIDLKHNVLKLFLLPTLSLLLLALDAFRHRCNCHQPPPDNFMNIQISSRYCRNNNNLISLTKTNKSESIDVPIARKNKDLNEDQPYQSKYQSKSRSFVKLRLTQEEHSTVSLASLSTTSWFKAIIPS